MAGRGTRATAVHTVRIRRACRHDATRAADQSPSRAPGPRRPRASTADAAGSRSTTRSGGATPGARSCKRSPGRWTLRSGRCANTPTPRASPCPSNGRSGPASWTLISPICERGSLKDARMQRCCGASCGPTASQARPSRSTAGSRSTGRRRLPPRRISGGPSLPSTRPRLVVAHLRCPRRDGSPGCSSSPWRRCPHPMQPWSHGSSRTARPRVSPR
jgi:hypothetical protein